MLRLVMRPLDAGWRSRHGAKVAGFLAGSLGTIVLALFVLVAVTGEPYGYSPQPVESVLTLF